MRLTAIRLLVLIQFLFSTSWSAEDPLGNFIEKKIKKTSPVSSTSQKTKLDAYRDPLAQLAIAKGAVDLGQVTLLEPTEAEKKAFRAEYEKSIKDLKRKGTDLYLNTEMGQTAPIYSKSGLQEEECNSATDCEVLIQATTKGSLKSMGEATVSESEDEYKRPWYMGYIKVQYETMKDSIKVQKEGWMLADSLSSKEVAPLYRTSDPDRKELKQKAADCPPGQNPQIAAGKDIKNSLEDALKPTLNLESKVDKIQMLIGQCLMSKPNEAVDFKGLLAYDDKILPVVSKAAAKSKDPNQKQIIEIDAIARTLYAEMGNCFGKGLQYPMAVARVILNRKEFTEGKNTTLFVKTASNHSKMKLVSAQVATEPTQFSAWLKEISGKPNPSLKHLMCPPSGDKNFFWKGTKVSNQEKTIWNQSVKIAAEMTLFPDQFKKRTASLKGIHFYTSGAARIKGITKKITPSIEGRPLALSSCINVFKDP